MCVLLTAREQAPALRRLPRRARAPRARRAGRGSGFGKSRLTRKLTPDSGQSAQRPRRSSVSCSRHELARLEVLDVGDPARRSAAASSAQHAGAERAAAADVGEVGADACRLRRSAADGVAGAAAFARKAPRPRAASGAVRRARRRRLAREPGVERRPRGSATTYERHPRVLRAAELGALAAIARPARAGRARAGVHAARDHVDLAGERRHPEAVDDVVAVQRRSRPAARPGSAARWRGRTRGRSRGSR